MSDLTAKQRVVLEEMQWLGTHSEPHPPKLVHYALGLTYHNKGFRLEADVDTIRKQLERLVDRKLVLKRKNGYVISARGRRALA